MGSGKGAARDDPLLNGPWLSEQARETLPNLRRQFELNRDPMVRDQLRDLALSEAERREGNAGRGSAMVKRDRPSAEPHPPPEMRRSAERTSFSDRWLVEQRDAVLAGAATRQTPSTVAPKRGRASREPSP